MLNEILVNDSVFLTLIAERRKRDALVVAVREMGGIMIKTMYGKGSVKASYLRDIFGFTSEEQKIVITCLLPRKKSDAMFEMLIERFHFDKPNTGIAFSVPIDKLSF